MALKVPGCSGTIAFIYFRYLYYSLGSVRLHIMCVWTIAVGTPTEDYVGLVFDYRYYLP